MITHDKRTATLYLYGMVYMANAISVQYRNNQICYGRYGPLDTYREAMMIHTLDSCWNEIVNK